MNAEALAKRLAWSGAALSWLLNVPALIFMAVGTDVARPESYGPASSTAIDLLAAFIPPVVGAIIASHRPRNLIGWLLLAGALTSSFTSFAGEWSFYAFFVRPGSLFWADAAVIVTQTFWIVNLTVLPLVALLFPSGSLLSPRWRLVAVTACAPVALALPLLVWAARSESGLQLLQETAELDGVVDVALIASIVIALATLVAGVLSLLLRYLRGRARPAQADQVAGGRGGGPGGGWTDVAAFGPLRSRVQDVVDRRFNRSRYDTEHTVSNFGSHLRQQTDLDSLTAELLDVVGATMQPAQASLWLGGADSNPGRDRP